MRGLIKSSKLSGVAGVAAALWLLLAGPAQAGGGMDAGSLLVLLCNQATTFGIPCPQYPTYFQTNADGIKTTISPGSPIALEIAAWGNVGTVLAPSLNQVLNDDSDCGAFTTPPTPLYCQLLTINATNGPAKSPPSDPAAAMSFLNPLTFIGKPAHKVPLTVTQNKNDPTATGFLYAVALDDQNGQPQALDLIFDNVAGTRNPIVISLPLAVLANGAATENSVVATLTANCNVLGFCSNVSVSTNPPLSVQKKSYTPADLGWSFNYFFDTSPNSSTKHPIVDLRVPFLVNQATDPIYFIGTSLFTGTPLPGCPNDGNALSGYCNAFSAASPPNGFAPKFLRNTVVGMAPSAAPQCPGNQPGLPSPPGAVCPPANNIGGDTPPNEVIPPNPAPVPSTFGFCATFSNKLAAAFFLAVGTDGSVIVSSPVASASTSPYPACPS
jgi:hypothetical protein